MSKVASTSKLIFQKVFLKENELDLSSMHLSLSLVQHIAKIYFINKFPQSNQYPWQPIFDNDSFDLLI